MEYKDILTRAGLSESETIVYDFLLKEGEVSAGQIAKKIPSLKRGNTYNILKSLISKGLVEQFEKNKTAHFRLEHPSKLKDYLNKQTIEIEHVEKTLGDLLPSLISEYNLTHNKPGVHYFEGVEGIKKIYEDTIADNPEKKVMFFRSHLDSQELGLDFFDTYSQKRARAEIKTQIISSKEITTELQDKDKRLLKERKFWKDFNPPAEIDIYHDKVAIISFDGGLVGTIIENKAISLTLKKIFEQVWKSL